jgi:AAHS family 4-hydroxybenzoate transporter-like MFS transporter
MQTSRTFDVDDFLDTRKVGWPHLKIVILLVLAMMIDGYDIFVTGYTLPVLAKGLHVAPQDLTGVFVLQQLGLLIGTFVVGPVADRFGRRTTLLVGIACFSVCTLAVTQVTNVGQFLVIRFISSIFFSSVIPNSIALSSEVAPRRLRAGAVSLVFCGYTGGNFIGAIVQAWFLEPFGWQSAFWIGGLMPVAVFILLFLFLPESIRFRTLRNPNDRRIGDLLRRIDPGLRFDGTERFVMRAPEAKAPRAPIVSLFSDGRLRSTLLLWAAFLSTFIVSHLIGSWNTTVLHNVGGLSLQRLALIASFSTAAGIIGTGTSGFIMDRFGPTRVLPLFLTGAAIAIACLGLVDLHSPMILVVAVASGYFSNSGLGGLNALGAVLYPTRMRATGVSWAAGAGRLGGMLGPVFGGAMLAQHWSLSPIYICAGAPALAAAAAILFIGRVRDDPHAAEEGELAAIAGHAVEAEVSATAR